MSLTNADLRTVSQPGEPDRRGGGIAYESPVTANLRCTLLDPTGTDRNSTNTRIASATAVLIIKRSIVPSTVQLAERVRVVVRRDLETADQTFEISSVSAPTKAGGLSHYKCWLTEVKP